MKKYQLSLNTDYCSHWNIQDAIRELLQNMLDSDSDNDVFFEDGVLNIGNKCVTIPSRTLLLGVTSKDSESKSLGGFGEGFKLAMLVLCREGYKVTVNNGCVVWTPSIEYSDLYDCDTLVVTETNSEVYSEDLYFKVEGLTQDDMSEVIKRCLYLQDVSSWGDFDTCKYGRVLYDIKGGLYVGGLFVKNTDMEYTYDFNPEHLKLNRDRQSIDGWDLGLATSKMLVEVSDNTRFNECLEKGSPDVYHSKYTYVSDEIVDSYYSLYTDQRGVKVIADSEDDKKDLISDGYCSEDIIIESDEVKYKILTRSGQYKKFLSDYSKLNVDEETPLDVLWVFYKNNVDSFTEYAKDDFKEILDKFKQRGVEWQG